MDISFVIPCYCSEKNLEGVISEIEAAMKKREGFEYEIILVNDNSKDNTKGLINRLSKENGRIIGINFAKNFGQPNALLAGFNQASGKYIMTSDDDGQTPADELYSLVDKLEEGYDVVYATYANKQHSGFRNFGSKINDYMCDILLNKPRGLMVTSYFAARRFVIDEVCRYQNPYTYVIGLIFRTTKNIGTVSVTHRQRQYGHSGYTFGKLLGLWINGFTAFSVKPLRIATATGVLFAILGFLYVIYIIINKCINPAVPLGWSSTTAVLLIVGGIILCMMGLIGEYLGRIYISMNNSPQYVIREKVGAFNEESEKN